jgi:beta-lactamase regulating signal transducer with metallopeptidase domain
MTPAATLQVAGWTVVHFLWQGAAIAALAAVLLQLTGRRSPNVRYLIACAALVLMLAAPALTARLLWLDAGQRVADVHAAIGSESTRASATLTLEASRGTGPVDQTIVQRTDASRGAVAISSLTRNIGIADTLRIESDRIVRGIAFAWLIGVAFLLARMGAAWWHIAHLHRRALATQASAWQNACRRIAYRLGLPAAAHVIESAAVDVPTVVGWIRPVIILPVAALAPLTPAQVEAILAHELAHIRRHDYAVNLLQTIAETLLFYHPAVWWISRCIRSEREHCCDDVAVRMCGDAVAYAQALADLEAWRASSPQIALAATGGSLLARIRRILRVPIADEPRSAGWGPTVALTLAFTAGAGGVQYLPSWMTARSDARAASAQTAIENRALSAVAPTDRPLVAAEAGRSLRAAAAPDAARVQSGGDDSMQPPAPPTPPEPPEPPEPPAPPVPPEPSTPVTPPTPPAPPRISAPPAPPSPPTSVASTPVPPAPPAPPAQPPSPVPPAPPAPPAFDGSVISRNGTWHIQWRDGLERFDITLEGAVTFTDDLADVATLSDGGTLTIRQWRGVAPHTIEIRSSGGRLTHTYFVAGVPRTWDAAAQRELAELLPIVVRRSGIGAESRVKSIFQRKGVSGVLDEIGLLGGDYARRLYFVALIDTASLDATGVPPVLAQVGQRIKSDYDRRVVLQHVAERVRLDARGASAYVQALISMTSDYDRRTALVTLVRAAGQNADPGALLTAINQMRSSYDKRQVLDALIERGTLSRELKQTVLRAAAGTESDYDCAEVLLSYVDRFGVESPVRDDFFGAVTTIGSAYDRRRVLSRVAKHQVNADVLQGVFAAVGSMSSDYDRAETLLAFVGNQALDARSRQAFLAAADRIHSSHDQNRVLAALARSDRR